mmetsp:Transcript_5609/g.10585  ORF Transcript_5609/g.10585 Transcript_5609/m.10585 type:complete len:111 (-) Transcript_5609:319-651(-)
MLVRSSVRTQCTRKKLLQVSNYLFEPYLRLQKLTGRKLIRNRGQHVLSYPKYRQAPIAQFDSPVEISGEKFTPSRTQNQRPTLSLHAVSPPQLAWLLDSLVAWLAWVAEC